ncbi:nitrate ABC transporter permease [Yinghuangia seranimata]|uniref:nitrate ABC transporter permease n=1 Tax=Yinghuangia seranimata TaxID=408067 RepID=UPI00248A9964|nr:nitrate ABC transporter permease [Yinghuangia seranimata]MDI2132373.1 nitrate ABC transporter permease [Yinghuangia seranimata]
MTTQSGNAPAGTAVLADAAPGAQAGADGGAATPPPPRRAGGGRLRAAASAAAWSLVGLAVLVGLWLWAAADTPELPKPTDVLSTLGDLLGDPFYDRGPGDKGIGVQLLTSLQRVFTGFGLAALVGIPLGLLMGGSKRAWQAVNPVVQLLRPVSPLAWFPLGLVVLKDSPQAAVFVIFVTALWPTVLNTAAGAASVPDDQRNVAKVFRFGRFAYVRHVMVPHSLPSIVTGLRLSMGIAWMVIVAVEMLSGSTGIGSFVWNSYNGGDLSEVISAIVLIGGVGFALDMFFLWLLRLVGGKAATP